ncbi:MAG: hypothetical protein K2H64_09445 [Desulfovibrio sp.]|nr:hypothetical protein [Desulfovibrio sp.]
MDENTRLDNDLYSRVKFLEAELAKKSATIEALEREKAGAANLYAIAGAVGRALRQNIGNVDIADRKLFEGARSLSEKIAWLAGKVRLSVGSPLFRIDAETLPDLSGWDMLELWFAETGLESLNPVFRVIGECKERLRKLPEEFAPFFPPVEYFSAYFNALERLLDAIRDFDSEELGSLKNNSKKSKINLKKGSDDKFGEIYLDCLSRQREIVGAIALAREKRERALAVCLACFRDSETDDANDSFAKPIPGAIEKFIRETKI